jgi:hypothetical protein
VPITNYGIAISVLHGVIEKVLEVFPEALSAYKKYEFKCSGYYKN